MFKPGDKVKRKQTDESDHWWYMVCQKFKQNTRDVFTVKKIEPDESIQLVECETYEFMPQNFELAESTAVQMSKFKPGDKVKRIVNSPDSWWKFMCDKYNQHPGDVFTVNTTWGNNQMQLDEFLQDPECEFDPDYFELAEQPKETTKMISLKDNHTALVNLGVTIRAIEQLDGLIAYYSEDKPGPAYVSFQHSQKNSGSEDIQIDRKIMLVALKEQRQRLVDYMATLGIDANN